MKLFQTELVVRNTKLIHGSPQEMRIVQNAVPQLWKRMAIKAKVAQQ